MKTTVAVHEPIVEASTAIPLNAQESLTEAELRGLQFLQDNPGIKIHIHFSKHGRAEDLGDVSVFEKPLAGADIHAIEHAGHTKSTRDGLEKLSHHSVRQYITTRRRTRKDSFERRIVEAVYAAKKPTVIADMPADHRLAKQATRDWHGRLYDLHDAYSGDMAHPIIQKETEQEAAVQNIREWVSLSELGSQLAKLAKTDPEIARKLAMNNLKVFMTRGRLHTGEYHKLRELGLEPTRSFPSMPQVFNPVSALVRQKILEAQKVLPPQSKGA